MIVEGHTVDCFWPEQRLVVELDGYAYHRTRGAFEHDIDRDLTLAAAGFHHARVTWRDLGASAGRLRRMLTR